MEQKEQRKHFGGEFVQPRQTHWPSWWLLSSFLFLCFRGSLLVQLLPPSRRYSQRPLARSGAGELPEEPALPQPGLSRLNERQAGPRASLLLRSPQPSPDGTSDCCCFPPKGVLSIGFRSVDTNSPLGTVKLYAQSRKQNNLPTMGLPGKGGPLASI